MDSALCTPLNLCWHDRNCPSLSCLLNVYAGLLGVGITGGWGGGGGGGEREREWWGKGSERGCSLATHRCMSYVKR